METKPTGRIFCVIILAGIMMLTPLNVLADEAKRVPYSADTAQNLETKIREALREHKGVEFEVKGEDVLLQGYVHTRTEKNILEDQIRGVQGVKYVLDKVKIRHEESCAAEECFEDTAITTKVKANILVAKSLNSLDIHVITDDGVVTLSGTVDCVPQVELAGKVAHAVKGVRRVVNKLSILK